MLLIIDNYDSFVYNIIHYLNYPDSHIIVKRNDAITIDEIKDAGVQAVILSPGPMGPDEAGICIPLIKTFYDRIPILGICLGHQCIGKAFGCTVERYYNPTHGKQSLIHYTASPLYKGLTDPFNAGRYHSLYINEAGFNHDALTINARLSDNTIMGIEHKQHPVYGVQFHPESILSADAGKRILNNFITIAGLTAH